MADENEVKQVQEPAQEQQQQQSTEQKPPEPPPRPNSRLRKLRLRRQQKHLPKIQIPKKACPCKLEGRAKSITACRQHSFWLVRLLILRPLRACLLPS